ncbi:MAG: methyltransferase domain-containing protein [Nitrospirales bacterium]|nr:MAG: methyltransferase domain-containing protein [Nitrospirales bacterium]
MNSLIGVHSFNRQMYQMGMCHSLQLPCLRFPPMLNFYDSVESGIQVKPNGILVENGQENTNQNYFYLNEHIKELSSAFPDLTFYCSAKPKVHQENVVDCSHLSLREISALGNRCVGFLTKGGPINFGTLTEANRGKPSCIVGWNCSFPVWGKGSSSFVYAKNLQEVHEFLLSIQGKTDSQSSIEKLPISSALPVAKKESAKQASKNTKIVKKPVVLLVTHTQQQCGVYQYAVNISQALQQSKVFQFSYQECSNAEELERAVRNYNPAAIIYNYHPLTMSWVNRQIIRQWNIPQFHIMHEVTQEEADRASDDLFHYHLCPDPTLRENNPRVFKIPRLIPLYQNNSPLPDKVTIGSFGFGLPDKGFERVVDVVQKEFDSARIILHIPFNDIIDPDGTQLAQKVAARCRKRIFKPGIELNIKHDFLTKQKLLEELGRHTANAFFYQTQDNRGISSAVEFALAVQRPVAITKCVMFRHLWEVSPSICIEDSSFRTIIQNGIAPLAPFVEAWNEESFIHALEKIVGTVLQMPQWRKTEGTSQFVGTSIDNGNGGYCKGEDHLPTDQPSQLGNLQNFSVQEPQGMSTETNGRGRHDRILETIKNRRFNRILDDQARRQYQPAVDQLFELAPEVMNRKIPEANVQQAFVLDAVQMFAASEQPPRILCVGSFEDSAAYSLKRLGYEFEEIDPILNYDLNEFFHKSTTKKGSWDIIFSTSVLEHVEDDEQFMKQIGELLAPGGTAILTCDYNDQYQVGDRLPQEDYRFYTQHDFMKRLLPLLQGCTLVDEPQWECPNPDFTYANCRYTFATFVFQKEKL